jgi:SAM-dependent methyltransferase
MDPKRIVESGYDCIAETYRARANATGPNARTPYIDLLLSRLATGAAVLELGCGTGEPTARELATRFAVTGVDLSGHSVALAREGVPNATFLHADMASLMFPPASFDAVVAFYSIIHLPRAEHAPLLGKIATWLRPRGIFIATLGAGATEHGYADDWHGAPMYWSHFDSETNRGLVRSTGLEIERAEEETTGTGSDAETFLWVIARKPV